MAKSATTHDYKNHERSWTETKREQGEARKIKEPRSRDISTTPSAPSLVTSPSQEFSGVSFHIPPITSMHGPAAESLALISKLKSLYKAQNILPKLIEDDSIPDQRMDDYYVNLQILLNDKGDSVGKQQIKESQIFDKIGEQEATQKVLITGGAGIGKTTLLHYIYYQWSKENIFADKFDYVFKIKLKKLLSVEIRTNLERLDDKDILPELIKKSIGDQQLDLEARGINSKGITISEIHLALKGKAVLLLDGYDEIAHLDKRDDAGSVVYKTMRAIDNYSVIVTSRPNAISPDKEREFGRKIEITGLKQEEAESYINKYFTKQQELLLEAVDKFYKKNSKIDPKHSMQGMELFFKKQPQKIKAIKEIIKEKSITQDQQSLKLSIESHYQSIESALKNLLSNPNLKEVITIPINLVMLCLITSDEKAMSQFHGDFNAGTLYNEAITWLSKRYVDKYKDFQIQYCSTKGIFGLKELLALKEIAYSEFKEGRISNITGKTIDHFSTEYIKEMPDAIGQVYRFGLLKTENVVIASKEEGLHYQLETDIPINEDSDYEENIEPRDNGRDKGLNKRNLINENHTFIHLSFQEYLTAHFLKEKLLDPQINPTEEVIEVGKFIGEHRNQPRYLMTLKFLAGLVSNHEYDSRNIKEVEQAGLLVTRFWEAVTCNVDGVLELGIEAKVTLLMHLLGQAKIKEGSIDSRIPNLAKIKDLIDKTILEDITKWGQQIIDSGYLSEKIAKKLISILIQEIDLSKGESAESSVSEQTEESYIEGKEEKHWEQKASNPTIDNFQKLKVAAEVIISLINKKDLGGKEKIFKSFVNLIRSKDWQIQKLGLEKLHKIIDGTIDHNSLEECSKLITPLLKDNNLINYANNVAAKITEIIPSETIKYFIAIIEKKGSLTFQESSTNSLFKIIKVIQFEEIFKKIKLILNDKEASRNLKEGAAKCLSEIVGAQPSTAVEAFEVIKLILYDKEASGNLKEDAARYLSIIVGAQPSIAAEAFEIIMSIVNDEEVIEKVNYLMKLNDLIEALTPREAFKKIKFILSNNESNNDIKELAAECFYKIVKDLPLIAGEDFEAINSLLKNKESSHVRKHSFIDSLPKTIKALLWLGDEVFKFQIDSLNDKRLGTKYKEDTLDDLYKIAKTLPLRGEELLKAIKFTLNDQESRHILQHASLDSLSDIVEALRPKQIFEAARFILNTKESSWDIKKVVLEYLPKIVKDQPSIAREAFEEMKLILNNKLSTDIMRVVLRGLPEIVKYQPSIAKETFEEIKLILNSRAVKLHTVVEAKYSLKEIIQHLSFNEIATLLNDESNIIRELATVAISDKLKDKREVKKLDYKQAVIILNIMELTRSDEENKELNLSAKKALQYIATTVDETGIEWLIDLYDKLPYSSEAGTFLKAVFHKTLSDSMISETEAKFITKCIVQRGFTAIIVPSKGKVIFESAIYTLREDNKSILEQIVNHIIDTSKDRFTLQYKSHEPLFINTGSGLPIASTDIKEGSLVDGQELAVDSWKLSIMHLSNHKYEVPSKVMVFLERRGDAGEHVVYKAVIKEGNLQSECNLLDPRAVSAELRQNIFGSMEYIDTKPRYYGSVCEINRKKGDALIEQIDSIKAGKLIGKEYEILYKLLTDSSPTLSELNPSYRDSASWEQYIHREGKITFDKIALLKADSHLVRKQEREIDIQDEQQIHRTQLKDHDKQLKQYIHSLEQLKKTTADLTTKIQADARIKGSDKVAMERTIESINRKMQNLANKEDMEFITSKMKELMDQNEITRIRLKDLESDVDQIIKTPQASDSDDNPVTIVFTLNEVEYDNVLLNYPKLIKEVLEVDRANFMQRPEQQSIVHKPFTFNTILDLSPRLNHDLLTKAINDSDAELILKGLIGLECYDYYNLD